MRTFSTALVRRCWTTSGRIATLALALGVWIAGCGGETQLEPVDLVAEAQRLAQEVIIVDTHIDVPYRLMEKMADISARTEDGDFDYPRARAGGLNAPFMSIYVPAKYQETGGAKEYADQVIDLVEGFATDWPDKFSLAYTPDHIYGQFEDGKISLAMGMENGAPIEDSLDNLKHFFDRGIRYITLTHGEDNQISDSSYAEEHTWKGLSPFGRQVVAEMNRLGIMIDVSHVSDDAFYQVMELSHAPVIASHSSCRKFTPDFERNMGDEMIQLLAEKGGVIQINFGSAFLTEGANKQALEKWDRTKAWAAENGFDEDSPEAEAFGETYWEDHERIYADIADVVGHIEHVIELVGVDHVGLGSDFDGVGDSLPVGLKDVSDYPNLIHEMLSLGHSAVDIRKIFGGNALRVWLEVEDIAQQLQEATLAAAS